MSPGAAAPVDKGDGAAVGAGVDTTGGVGDAPSIGVGVEVIVIVGDGVAAASGVASARGVSEGVAAGVRITCVGDGAVAGVALGVGDGVVTVGSTVCVGDGAVAGVALAVGAEVVVVAAGSGTVPFDGAGMGDSAEGVSAAAGWVASPGGMARPCATRSASLSL
jgi:hypothetical protein